MKLGIFSVVDHYPKELPRTAREFYFELLERAQLAEQLGFDSFWIAEHHFHEYGAIPDPAVWMAAAAMRTERIRLGVAVSVLPFHNPLLVAESYAMVDMLSGGRLEFGAGSGYLAHEFEGFNLPREEKAARFDEALDIIRRAWAGTPFSFEGRFHTVRNVCLQISPVQKPHPPVHVAVLRNEAAQGVGSRGYPLLTIPYATSGGIEELAEMVDRYKTAYTAAGHSASAPPQVTGALHTYATDHNDGVQRYGVPALDRYVRTRLYALSRPYEVLKEKDLVAFGKPDEVIRVIRRYEKAGFTGFLCLADFGGMEHRETLRSIELLGRHVLPAFR